MITLNFTCCMCGQENTAWGAQRFIHSQHPVTLRIKDTPCFDCYTTREIARNYLRARGEWFPADPGEWR